MIRWHQQRDDVSLTTEGATTTPYRHDCGCPLTQVVEPQLDEYNTPVGAYIASTTITYWLAGRKLVTLCPGCFQKLHKV